jgi:hypothetical protein
MSIEKITAEREFLKGWDSWDENEITEAVSHSMNQKSAKKKDLRYVNNEAAFLNDSYDVFGKYLVHS